jgi:nucleotide-binding universal stress UspA family protein
MNDHRNGNARNLRHKNMLVAYDGSESAKLALARATTLAREFNYSVTALWIRESCALFPESVYEIQDRKMTTDQIHGLLKREVEQWAHQQQICIDLIEATGNPSDMIIAHAIKLRVCLIILGTSGHSSLWNSLFSYNIEKITSRVDCDVLIVKNRKKDWTNKEFLPLQSEHWLGSMPGSLLYTLHERNN